MLFLSTVMQLFYVWWDNIFTSFAAGGETCNVDGQVAGGENTHLKL